MSWWVTGKEGDQTLYHWILIQGLSQKQKQRKQTQCEVLQGQEKVLQGQEDYKEKQRKNKTKKGGGRNQMKKKKRIEGFGKKLRQDSTRLE